MRQFFHVLCSLSIIMAMTACSSDEKDPPLFTDTNSISFSYKGGTYALSVITGTSWSLTGLPEWMSASAVTGVGSTDIVLEATSNESQSDRSANLNVFTSDGTSLQAITIQQSGRKPLQVADTSQKILGGKASYYVEDSIVVGGSARWVIDGPSWVTAEFNDEIIPMNGTVQQSGGGTIYLYASETYMSDEPRDSVIRITSLSGNDVAVIPVKQLSKDDVVPVEELMLSDGFACSFKFGADVTYLYFTVYEGSPAPSSELNYDFIRANWAYMEAMRDNVVCPADLTPNTNYYLYLLTVDSENYFNYLSTISCTQFRTKDPNNQPRAIVETMNYDDNLLTFSIKQNQLANGFHIGFVGKSLWNSFSNKTFWTLAILEGDDSVQDFAYGFFEVQEEQVAITLAVGKDGQLSSVADIAGLDEVNTSKAKAKKSLQDVIVNRKDISKRGTFKGMNICYLINKK